MPYFQIAPTSDNRRASQATVPIVLRNVIFEQTPAGSAKRSRYFLMPRHGRTRRAELQADCRGLFSEMGCRDGGLFAAAGSDINLVSSSYGYASIGTISGGDVVTMRAFRTNLGARAFGELYTFNGSTFTNVTDGDAPAFASTFATVGYRGVAANEGGDGFSWSVTGDLTSWPTGGAAADFDLPDPIVGQENVGGDLVSYNAASIQFWQPVPGAPEDEAFAPVQGATIRETGLFGRDAVARAGEGQMFLGSTRVIYDLQGFSVRPIVNRDCEEAIRSIADATLALATAWSFRDGSHEFWGLSAGLGRAFVYQRDVGAWLEWTRYGEDVFDIDFAVNAYGETFVAGKLSPYLWTIDGDVFTDDGDPILNVITTHIPSAGDVPLDRLVFDIETRAIPVSGDAAAPTMQVRVSYDNGQSWTSPEDIALPLSGDRYKAQMWNLGMVDPTAGLLVEVMVSEPFGFAYYGLWANPSKDEISI